MFGRTELLLCTILVTLLFSVVAVVAETGGDTCEGKGIVMKNLTLVDLRYKKNNGDCTILKRNYMVDILQGDTIELFTDLTCQTPYCRGPITYSEFKAVDSDRNCRVRLLLGCSLNDM